MSPIDELFDLLARAVGTINADDLADDPELSGLVAQLLMVLEPKAAPLPLNMIEQLASIENRMERFRTAAEMIGANDPARLKTLADSMRSAGLLKNDVAPGTMPETALEDLMKEHSVLRRIMAVYKKAMEGPIKIEAIKEAAKVVQLFVHDYHEEMEEKYVFPIMREKMTELVDSLCEQHQLVRKLTAKIIESKNPADVAEAAKEFVKIYMPHGAREDTELFPAWRESMSAEAYAQLGAVFREKEKAIFGDEGEEQIIKIVEELEKQLGISELIESSPLTKAEQALVKGTNCSNCKFLNYEGITNASSSELNAQGGIDDRNNAEIARAKKADLVTLPGDQVNGVKKGFCTHEELKMMVTSRMCCAFWDNKGAKRVWK